MAFSLKARVREWPSERAAWIQPSARALLRWAAREGKQRACSSTRAAAAGGPLLLHMLLGELADSRYRSAEMELLLAPHQLCNQSMGRSGCPSQVSFPFQQTTAEAASAGIVFEGYSIICTLHSPWPVVSSGGSSSGCCIADHRHELLRAPQGTAERRDAGQDQRTRLATSLWMNTTTCLMDSHLSTSLVVVLSAPLAPQITTPSSRHLTPDLVALGVRHATYNAVSPSQHTHQNSYRRCEHTRVG